MSLVLRLKRIVSPNSFSQTTLIMLIYLTLFSEASFAQSFFSPSKSGGSSAGRADIKRWTLQEWLAQKERNKMMDMWLAFNTPSPYEAQFDFYYLSYVKEVTAVTPNKEYTSYLGKIHAYARLVGLTAEHENNTKESYSTTTGIFNLRLFGNSLRNTSITLHYGQRTKNDVSKTPETTLRNNFAGASTQIYITKYFGISGHYRDYQEAIHDTLGKVKGSRTEGGIFIDFDHVRVFGEYFSDVENAIAPNTTTEVITTRTGVQSGLKILF